MSDYKDELEKFYQNNLIRYSEVSEEDRQIASLLNLVLSAQGVAGKLMDIDKRLKTLEEKK